MVKDQFYFKNSLTERDLPDLPDSKNFSFEKNLLEKSPSFSQKELGFALKQSDVV